MQIRCKNTLQAGSRSYLYPAPARAAGPWIIVPDPAQSNLIQANPAESNPIVPAISPFFPAAFVAASFVGNADNAFPLHQFSEKNSAGSPQGSKERIAECDYV